MARLNSSSGLLAARVLALEEDVEALAGTSSIGSTLIDGGAAVLSGNHSFVNAYSVDRAGTLSDFQVYLDGNATNTGLQRMRVIVYADGGAGTPSAYIGQSDIGTVTHGDAAAWKSFTGSVEIPAAGIYWIGLFVEVGGVSTNQVARWYTTTGPAGSLQYNSDTFSDGAADPFGSITGTTTAIIALTASFTPSAGISGVTIQDEGVQVGDTQGATTLNIVGDLVSVDLSSGVASITVSNPATVAAASIATAVIANYPLAADAVAESTPAAGAVYFVSAVGDQDIASTSILDSSDSGATWRTRASGGSAATFMNAQALTSRLTKVQIVNDSTNQGEFEATVGTA